MAAKISKYPFNTSSLYVNVPVLAPSNLRYRAKKNWKGIQTKLGAKAESVHLEHFVWGFTRNPKEWAKNVVKEA